MPEVQYYRGTSVVPWTEAGSSFNFDPALLPLQAVAQGPVAFAMGLNCEFFNWADQAPFEGYGGRCPRQACPGMGDPLSGDVDHAMTIVGYNLAGGIGNKANPAYWIVKNSWGPE